MLIVIEEARDRINTGHFNKLKQIKKTTPKIESCYLHEDEIPKELRAIRFAINQPPPLRDNRRGITKGEEMKDHI